jgi:hypothetical protein
MTESFFLNISATHVWQGPIPAENLPRLKSFARIGLKGFYGEDYEEYTGYQFIPADQAQFSIEIESENDQLCDLFDEDYILRDFPVIEIIFDDKEIFSVNIPKKISLTEYVLKQIYSEVENLKRYFKYLDEMIRSPDGFSEVSLGQGGFKCSVDLAKYTLPDNKDSIYPVVIKGDTIVGKFEYLVGILVDQYYFSLSLMDNQGECDLFYHSYFDEDFDLLMSFSQWHAGCDVQSIGDRYKSEVSEDMINSYLETNFQISSDEDFIVKLGYFSSMLSDLHKQHGCDTSAIITAWNPHSEPLPEDENHHKNEALKKIVMDQYVIVTAAGVDPKGERSYNQFFLLLGISRYDAMQIGKKFQQNSIVFNESAIPELIMLK